MSSQSGKSQSELFLDELELGVTGFIIVMICRIWDVIATTGHARSNVAHNFLRLKEGNIYLVKNSAVHPNKDEFRIMKNAAFMLEVDGATTVRKAYVISDGFFIYLFQLVNIDNLEVANNKYLIDAASYVTNVGRTTHQRTGSRHSTSILLTPGHLSIIQFSKEYERCYSYITSNPEGMYKSQVRSCSDTFRCCIIQTNYNMSSQSGKSQSELFLDELELGVTGFIIVMICRIWDVIATTGHARSNVAHNFLRLKEGNIYLVKNSAVHPNKDEFRIMKNAAFMLEVDGATTVRKAYVISDGFFIYLFQLVNIDNLEVANNKYLIDAASYVTNVGRTTHQRTGSRHSTSILLTPGGLGDVLIEKRTRYVGLYPVFLTALTVKLYNNRIYLSSTSSTLILDDDQIPVVKQLKTNDKQSKFTTAGSGVDLTKESLPVDHTEPKSSTFHCIVKIENVRTKKGWNYPSCGGEGMQEGFH
nr:hypothetical protein [Tanacetum cinerariifolium]